jgi:CheY-like chemotaxis protein
LVNEDEPEMRRNITTLLRYDGYQPIEAENGRVGLALAQRENPNLVLCDVMMPGAELNAIAVK